MKKIKLIWLIIFNKKFSNSLLKTMLYAMNVEHVIGGNGSENVSDFRLYQDLVIDEKTLDTFYYNNDIFKIPPKSLIEILTKYNDEELEELKKFK